MFKSKQSVCTSVADMWVTAASPLSCRHPTSCCSVAEIMSVLFFHTMKYRYDDPRNFNNDRFILSKVTITQSYRLFLYFWLCLNAVQNLVSLNY